MALPALPWRHYGFGLELHSEFRIPLLPSAGVSVSSAETRLSKLEPWRAGAWRYPGEGALMNRRYPDRRLMIGVEREDNGALRVWAPGYGRFVVSKDGKRIAAGGLGGSAWKWQRLLFAQVLPLAAALQGFEVFHASAVALNERVFAFTAPSGTGKTSAALSLVARGAMLMTDDVLVLSPTADGEVLAHPGASLASVSEPDLSAFGVNGSQPIGRVLAALFLLERNGSESHAVEFHDGDAGVVLASAFLTYLDDTARLRAHLEACALLSRTVRLIRVVIPASAGIREVADELAAYIQSQ
jgi:hypothetical protein